jgi:ABC-type Mn2+/Zn2+ transport system permease subunit
VGWLSEPLHYAFMQTGLLAAVLVGVTYATLGVYVVLRRLAFIGDALAHALLPGLVVAYLNGWSLFDGAVLAGALTALGIGWVSRHQMLGEDTAIGILFTSMFALGILLSSMSRSFRDLSHLLFGNILGVTPGDLALIAVVLTNALLIIPAARAALLTDRLPGMMLLAAGIAVVSSVVGLYGSYYWHVSSGAAIVLTCTACFGGSWGIRQWRQRQRAHPRRA